MESLADELRSELTQEEEARKEKHREVVRQYNKKNYSTIAGKRDKVHNASLQRDLQLRNKVKLIKLMGGRCIDCDKSFPPAVYDFHHLVPETKASSIRLGWKWSRILKEATKCVLLCANCHRIRHI